MTSRERSGDEGVTRPTRFARGSTLTESRFRSPNVFFPPSLGACSQATNSVVTSLSITGQTHKFMCLLTMRRETSANVL